MRSPSARRSEGVVSPAILGSARKNRGPHAPLNYYIDPPDTMDTALSPKLLNYIGAFEANRVEAVFLVLKLKATRFGWTLA
jgi:hypothetical protein